MRAIHRFKVKKEGVTDFIVSMEETPLKLEGNYIARKEFNDKGGQSCTIYVSPIQSLVLATSELVKHKDLYAIIVGGDGNLDAVDVGRAMHGDFYLFDMNYYSSLKKETDKIEYVLHRTVIKNFPDPFHIYIHDVSTGKSYGQYYFEKEGWLM